MTCKCEVIGGCETNSFKRLRAKEIEGRMERERGSGAVSACCIILYFRIDNRCIEGRKNRSKVAQLIQSDKLSCSRLCTTTRPLT